MTVVYIMQLVAYDSTFYRFLPMTLFKALLIFHIISGSIALLSGIGASAVKQFDWKHIWHVRFGTAFFYTMIAIFVSALAMSLMNDNTFLLLVSLFSFYFAFTGWRYAKNKAGIPMMVDWSAVILLFVVSIIMIAFGLKDQLGEADGNGVTLIVFGLLGIGNSLVDYFAMKSKTATGKKRIALHVTKMLAGLIATVTAFVVTNFTANPEFILWIAPTIFIVPYIVYWNRKLKK